MPTLSGEVIEQLISELITDDDVPLLNENISVALSFIFPVLYLKAIQLLQNGKIKKFQYTPSQISLDKDDLSATANSSLAALYETDQNIFVDTHSWFCSCQVFADKLTSPGTSIKDQVIASVIQVGDIAQIEHKGTSKGRSRFDNDFIPLCEHLLALWMYEVHAQKLERFGLKIECNSLTFEEWIEFNKEIVFR